MLLDKQTLRLSVNKVKIFIYGNCCLDCFVLGNIAPSCYKNIVALE
ncbi:hypothetical protein DB42_CD00110 [Neochlamydia sp. EPS4]|nr:hypothetical protein DB42_CD00110 [Neochlamydia sp. EPS4]